MSIFSIFNKKNDVFSFDINYDNTDWGVKELPKEVSDSFKEFHNTQKMLFDNHIKFITESYPEEFKKDKLKIKKSCLEFAVLFSLVFSQEFVENNISNNIGMTYLIPIFNNFRDLQKEIKEHNYENLHDFFSVKSTYLSSVLSNTTGDKGYFFEIFISNPIKNINPILPFVHSYDAFKTMQTYIYALNTIKAINENAQEFVTMIQKKS